MTETDPAKATDDSGRDPCAPNRVLIVDDEPALRDVFERVLSFGLPDCKFDTAADGKEGLAAFSDAHHSIVLMDLHMPRMDGERAFLEIQKVCDAKKWQLPSVVFCTGYDPPNTVREIAEANPMHCLLQKPISNDALIDAVQKRINR